MIRVLEREEQAYRAGVGFDSSDLRHRLADGVVFERPHHPPAGRHPLVDFDPALARDQGRGLVAVEIEHVRPDLPADLQKVAESGGGEQDHPPAAALDDGVGRDRGAVRQPPHVTKRHPRGGELVQPLDHRPPRVVAGRGPLRDPDLAVPGPHRVEIGERPSDVHPDDPAHALRPLRPLRVHRRIVPENERQGARTVLASLTRIMHERKAVWLLYRL